MRLTTFVKSAITSLIRQIKLMLSVKPFQTHSVF
ncbi:hypothetical protein OA78_2006 [Latilactobacillus curvatus]|nr:hypothetical protein OA78_2006 [Latilactobacillus curvatus]